MNNELYEQIFEKFTENCIFYGKEYALKTALFSLEFRMLAEYDVENLKKRCSETDYDTSIELRDFDVCYAHVRKGLDDLKKDCMLISKNKDCEYLYDYTLLSRSQDNERL
ncbi:hypothetical protein AN644_00160 [Candidatus Epulonipiscium fishelsonii]|nr:hypothetical protein AN644_00160 [Epulopiscium sp. SCG-C06WGA-EpuloA1]